MYSAEHPPPLTETAAEIITISAAPETSARVQSLGCGEEPPAAGWGGMAGDRVRSSRAEGTSAAARRERRPLLPRERSVREGRTGRRGGRGSKPRRLSRWQPAGSAIPAASAAMRKTADGEHSGLSSGHDVPWTGAFAGKPTLEQANARSVNAPYSLGLVGSPPTLQPWLFIM